MKGYGQITNPVTGRKVSVRGSTGQSVLRSYLQNAQSGGARKSRSRSRSRNNKQRGGNRDLKAVDFPLYGIADSGNQVINVMDNDQMEMNPAAKRHRRLVDVHGRPVGRKTSDHDASRGWHIDKDTVYAGNSGADEQRDLVSLYGATPTSLVSGEVVIKAVERVDGRKASRDLKLTMKHGADGTITTHYKKGEVFKRNYPAHVNAIYMANWMESAMRNNCNDDIHFVAINVPVAHLPPSHMVTSAETTKLLNEGGLDAALRTSNLSAAMQAAVRDQLQKQQSNKSVWRKMQRGSPADALIDYHGLKLQFRGMLFDFVMSGSQIKFSIDKNIQVLRPGSGRNDRPGQRARPSSKCLINPSGHLTGTIDYAVEGDRVVLKKCSLEGARSNCWPSKNKSGRMEQDVGLA